MKAATIKDVDFVKGDGLVPVIAQDASSGKVLMLAYANREALAKTVKTRFAYYYSRSRRKLWKKGEESGNLQRVKNVLVDCDGDTLLYVVNQKGPACHTGNQTCFFRRYEGRAIHRAPKRKGGPLDS